MAQTIKLKRSAVAGNVPGLGDLALGEVAINTTDGKMYMKKSVSGVESIVEVTSAQLPTDPTFDSITLTGAPGPIEWNSDESTVDVPLNSDVTLQMGQETLFYAKATEAISNGDVVMFAGAQGDHLMVSKADMSLPQFEPEYVIGIATQDFALNDFGFVTTFGKVRGLNTAQYTEGDVLYLDPNVSGGLTTTRPTPTDHIIQMCAVTRAHITEGTFLVRPTHFHDTDEVPEGTSNLYFTDARAVSAVATADQYVKNTGDTMTGNLTFSQDSSHVYFGNQNTFIGERSNSSNLELRGGGSTSFETIYLNNNGNLGLGTSNARARLEVKGLGGFSGGISVSNQNSAFAELYLTDNSGTADLVLNRANTGNADITIKNTGDIELAAYTSGNVGIGTTPLVRFHVEEDGTETIPFRFGNSGQRDTNISFYNQASTNQWDARIGTTGTDLRFATSNIDRLVIDSHGSILHKDSGANGAELVINSDMSVGARNLRLWGSTNVSPWTSFIGTNVKPDGDGTFTKLSDNPSSNWGNISGIMFDGANTSTMTAMRFLVDTPNTLDGSLNSSLSLSELRSRTAMSIRADGNVGIGTENSSYALALHKDLGAGGALAEFKNANSTYSQQLVLSFNSTKDILFAGGSSSGGFVFNPGSRGVTINSDLNVSGTVTANNFVGSIDYSNITNPPAIDNSVDYINAASFNTSTGVLTLSGVGRAGATVDLDGRYLQSYSETDTLDSVTSRGNTTTNNIEVGKINGAGSKTISIGGLTNTDYLYLVTLNPGNNGAAASGDIDIFLGGRLENIKGTITARNASGTTSVRFRTYYTGTSGIEIVGEQASLDTWHIYLRVTGSPIYYTPQVHLNNFVGSYSFGNETFSTATATWSCDASYTTKLGVGTTTPARRLEVYESSSSMVGQFRSGSGTSSFVCFANTASNADQVRVGSIGSDLVLSTSYSPKVRVKANGNVGIGTDNPLDLLHINSSSSDCRVIIDSATGFDPELKYAENGTVKFTTGYDAGTGNFVIGTNNVDTQPRLSITNVGRVLIGRSTSLGASGATNLEIGTTSGSNGVTIWSQNTASSSIYFADNNNNDAGSLVYSHSTDTLLFSANRVVKASLDGNGTFSVDNKIVVNDHYTLEVSSSALTSTTQTAIATFPVASFSTAKIIVQAKDTVTDEIHASELLIIHDGTTAISTEYAMIYSGVAPLATYDVDISGSNVRVLATSASTNNTTYKTTKNLIKV